MGITDWHTHTQCNGIVLFHTQPLLPYCPTVWNRTLPPQHKNTTLTPDSSFQTDIGVVSSDDAPWPPPSPTLLRTCSFVPATHHLFLCASYYMSMSLVIKITLWFSHVLVYWIKENLNIIVINANTVIIQHTHTHTYNHNSLLKNTEIQNRLVQYEQQQVYAETTCDHNMLPQYAH